ncbi:MAG: gamma-glutamyl-gamma-aminobutyrate hydrolase family protein [Candidatus Eremiobacteraeota bacterium]|nr:gamma-glutamyl-gamma-aminobutyrate hydrolase family protein [Candidatus Eremiobacteraeota bacterium]
MALRVGISYGPPRGSFPNYHRAVIEAGAQIPGGVETVDLAAEPDAVGAIDALLLSGGPDVEPARYGKPEYAPLCSLDPQRDEAEFRALAAAESRKLPILAICRGAQLLNVAHGGTLIPDLPDIAAMHHTAQGGVDRRHPVVIDDESELARIAGSSRGEVNSSHHQAIDRLAEGFVVTARADDETIEGFEWAQPEGKPFLLAVQWHPERLDFSRSLGADLFSRFVSAARA